jgi:hypothetical protein
MNVEYSLDPLMLFCRSINIVASGLDMDAWKDGFCRKMAAKRVDPERGNPEMK